MNIIPFPSPKSRHPSGQNRANHSVEPMHLDDVTLFGITPDFVRDHPVSAVRIIVRHHLFRMGFGESSSSMRVSSGSPIVARRDGEIIGVIAASSPTQDLASSLASARNAAEADARPEEEVSAAVMFVKFIDDCSRAEIVTVGSESLKSMPTLPFD